MLSLTATLGYAQNNATAEQGKRMGIDIFCNLPDEIEEHVERILCLVAWGLK